MMTSNSFASSVADVVKGYEKVSLWDYFVSFDLLILRLSNNLELIIFILNMAFLHVIHLGIFLLLKSK